VDFFDQLDAFGDGATFFGTRWSKSKKVKGFLCIAEDGYKNGKGV
jgi:hypothetical protein